MPFRSKETLESWLDEFRETREGGALISVLIQHGDDGADTGLVVVPLKSVSTEVYMQPVAIGDPRWSVTFGARPDGFELDSPQLQAMAAELALAASLCAFLQEKSVDHLEGAAQA